MPEKPINSHIIPRHHLKQFTNDVDCIFTYPDPDKHWDKQCKGKGGGSVVKNTAAKRGFYSEEIERILDQDFENRGSSIAYKILKKQSITPDERELFVKYIASFIYRVPASKRVIEKSYPRSLEQIGDVEYYLKNHYGKADPHTYYEALNDPDQKDKRIRLAWEYSIEIQHKLVYDALLSREWWVAEVVGSEYFITSDNPLFYSTASGITDRNVQITFPLSQRMAMVFDGYQEAPRNLNIKYCPASYYLHNQVDLINKQTADNSTYLYSPRRDIYVTLLTEHRVSSPERIRRNII